MSDDDLLEELGLVARPGAMAIGGDQLVEVTCRCGRDRGLVSASIAKVLLAHGCAGCWEERARALAAAAKRRRFKVVGAPIEVHVPAPRRRRPAPPATPNPEEELANHLPAEKAQEVIDRLNDGQSLRRIAREVGVAKGTVERYRKEHQTEALCECGLPETHQGMCAARAREAAERLSDADDSGGSPQPDEGEGVDQRTEDRVEKLLVQHTSIAQIIEQTGCGRVDVIALRDQLRSEGTVCQCGNELGHRGTCRGTSPAKAQPQAPELTRPSWDESAGVRFDGQEEFLDALDAQVRELRALISRAEDRIEKIEQVREGVQRLIEADA